MARAAGGRTASRAPSMSDHDPDRQAPDERAERAARRAPSGDRRFASLEQRLREALAKRRDREPPQAAQDGRGQALGLAFRIAAELAAGLGLGVLAGWQLDRLFGTRPWLLIILTLLGAAGGLWNVIRTAERMHRLDVEASADRGRRLDGKTKR
jgi:ATP synthase protein I